ncbi:oligosaccharide flippase family protein [Hafnia paralvei]|uniref:lipopolysaccharide biosynthesis protein n=1 Tax=Hafnia paralvei TaxID=546367 RepID=UPI0026DDCC2C|nr:oligosaccharide flippase family protein [Hafnia paralvei]MDX6909981.1 oligosaccharide flippase family protein [Hafnia paralvei]
MKRQIIKNIGFNGAGFICSVGTGLLLTPFLINKLGVAVYGLVPLALFFTFYMSIITQSLTSSVNRFFIASLQANDDHDANCIINTAFYLMLAYVLLQGVILFYPLLHINYFIAVPNEVENQTIILFFCVLISFSISLITSILSVSMYALNRLDLMQLIVISKTLTRFLGIIILFRLKYIGLQFIGFAMIISEVIALAQTAIIFSKLTPNILLNIKFFSFNKVKELCRFGGWLMIDQIGYVLFIKMDLLLVNKIFGPKFSGQYSIATQFSDLLRSLAGLMSGVLGPVVMIMHSKHEIENIASIANTFVKILSLTISIPICLICVFSNEILTIWIGKGFEQITPLIWLVTFPLIVNLGVLPLFSINVAYKKVKIPSLLNVFLAVIGIALSLVCISNTSWGYYSVAVGFGIALTLKNAIFIPVYAAKIMELSSYTFIKVHIKTIIFSAIYISLLFLFKRYISVHGILILPWLALLGCVGLCLTLLFYTREEKWHIIGFIKKQKIL